MLGSAFGSTIIEDPFTSSQNVTVTESDFPNIYNGTDNSDTFFGDVSVPSNSTEAGADNNVVLGFIPDYFEMPYAVLYTMIQFISGGWIFNAITVFGFPEYATTAFQIAIAFWAIYTMVYYFMGRG